MAIFRLNNAASKTFGGRATPDRLTELQETSPDVTDAFDATVV